MVRVRRAFENSYTRVEEKLNSNGETELLHARKNWPKKRIKVAVVHYKSQNEHGRVVRRTTPKNYEGALQGKNVKGKRKGEGTEGKFREGFSSGGRQGSGPVG